MPPASSPVSPDVVRKVAALARLSVPESELSVWTEQLGRIVSYIDQLKQLPEGPVQDASAAPATPLRPDEPEPGCGRQALEENARLLHEHGVVPRIVGGG
jgi:aspartyl/glutamyl-tRNA(Asn/Gln) amidotransferase C subunit